jgi:hypothetical protein
MVAALVLASIVILGCGETSGGNDGNKTDADNQTNTVKKLDNSKLSTGSNEYGYYGNKVVFGDTVLVGKWSVAYSNSSSKDTWIYEDDGVVIFVDAKNAGIDLHFHYGVSKDGKKIADGWYGEIRFIKKRSSGMCYNVEVATDDAELYEAVFCKYKS